jgi:hypothetical protein
MVHPALSWVEIQSTAVEQYSRFEVFDVAIASRSSFYRHDLTVDPFGHIVGSVIDKSQSIKWFVLWTHRTLFNIFP